MRVNDTREFDMFRVFFFFIKARVFVKAAYKISGTYLILVGLCIRDQKN